MIFAIIFWVVVVWVGAAFIITDLVNLTSDDHIAHFAHIGGVFFGVLSVIKVSSPSNFMNTLDRFFNINLSLKKQPKMKVYRNSDAKKMTDDQYNENKVTKAECSLTDMVGNVENFLDGSFPEGGWAGWFELTQSSYNDPNRSFLELQAEQTSIVLKTKDREYNFLEGNNYFFTVKECEMVQGDSTLEKVEYCKNSTFGNIVQHQLNDSLQCLVPEFDLVQLRRVLRIKQVTI